MSDLPVRVALQKTLQGLLDMLPSEGAENQGTPVEGIAEAQTPHLRWMLNHCLGHFMEWPVDKTSRWIGFVQGVMACRGLLDCNEERDRTRPFFHEAYKATGQAVPKTADPEPRSDAPTGYATDFDGWFWDQEAR